MGSGQVHDDLGHAYHEKNYVTLLAMFIVKWKIVLQNIKKNPTAVIFYREK